MGKIYVEALLLFSLLLIPFPMVRSIDKSPKGVEKWFKKLSNKREKIAKLHFYLHHTSMGKNQTTYQVAQPNTTVTSSPFFGILRVNDDLLKVGPQQDSSTMGYAQGIQASASLQNEIALAMNFNLVFTNNKYNGSTLGLLGRNEILSEYREMSIIGGSGHFRLARGIATLQTFWQNLTSGNAIIEYNLIVLHY